MEVVDGTKDLPAKVTPDPVHMNETEPVETKALQKQAVGQTTRARDGNLADVAFGSAEGPSFRRQARLIYPEEARRQGREGRVVLQLHIDARGHLVQAQVVDAAGYGFDEAALQAITASSFRPAERNGQAIECVAVLAIRFRLKE